MKLVHHRVNRIEDLKALASAQTRVLAGCEIDLRSQAENPGHLHLSHDPWQLGDAFEDWLKEYSRWQFSGPLILNTKEDGLEQRCLDLLRKYSISSFFFLDTNLPSLVRCSRQSDMAPRLCVRVSSFEGLSGALAFKDQVEWAWVDCFQGRPLPEEEVERVSLSFKICLVSPELQQQRPEAISRFSHLQKWASAVCTKFPEVWEKLSS
ncbi:MAG: hypothetical protein WCH11_02350 [Bdellovibrio sp.]